MNWIIEHWSEVSLIAGALYTAASVIVGLTSTKKDDKVLKKAARFVSFIRSANAPGSVKRPMSKE